MALNTFEIHELLKKEIKAVTSLFEEGPTPSIYVRADDILPVMKFLRYSKETEFDVLMNHTGFHETEDPKLFWHLFFDISTDEEAGRHHEEFRLFWNLYSYSLSHNLTVESSVPIGKPIIDSMTSIWKTADWLEREVFDLLGVNYPGHPDLRRIMMPEDWEGHPLRKDYIFPTSYNGIDNSPSEIALSFIPKGKE